MHDIIASKAAAKKAQERGYEPLLIGEDIALIKERKELGKHAKLLILGTSTERTLIEASIDGVTDIEGDKRKDHLKYRRGGLDQVSATILASEQKAYVVTFSSIKTSKDPAKLIGRILANIQIARKAKLPVLLVSGASKQAHVLSEHDKDAFFRAIGVPAETVHASKQALTDWVERAKLRASDRYVAEGVTREKKA